MRDKQVEEMANYCCYPCDLYDEGNEGKDCTYCDYKTCLCAESAKALYNAGYRKASDVAREIFEEIEKLMNKLDKRHIACGNPKQAWGVRSAMIELAELKKKYESEGEG